MFTVNPSISLFGRLIAIASLVGSALAFGKNPTPKELLTKMSQKYPKELGVYLEKNYRVKVEWLKDSLSITAESGDKILFLSDLATSLSEQSVSFSHFNTILSLDAYTSTPEKGKFKKVLVNDFETKDAVDESIFYNDVKNIQFNFPALQMGAMGVVNYKERMNDPYILHGHYFTAGVPVEKSVFSITYPKFIEIGYFKHGDTSLIKTSISETKTHRTITFTGSDLKKQKREEMAPSSRYFIPHVTYCIKSVNINGVEKKYLGDLDLLYKWDYSHISKSNTKPDSLVVATAKSLVKPGMSNLEKAKVIYLWVQENIKYIAFENGYEGFVPRNAGDVCRRKFGDCKDMSSILVEMMKAVGVPAHMTLIGTDELPYTFSSNPLPSAANHMIASLKDNDNYYFLDATGRFYPPFFPTQFIQGKEALIAISESQFEIVKVPIPKFSENVVIDSLQLEISERTLKGKGRTHLKGYRKIDFVTKYNNTLPDELKDMLDGYFHLGNNKFLHNNHKTINLNNRNLPSTITYDFTIDDYVVNFKEGLAVNLSLNKKWNGLLVDLKDRTQPMAFKYASQTILYASLQIPKGYKLGYLPNNQKFEDEDFSFSIQYKQIGNKIITEQIYNLKNKDIRLEKLDEWNSMLEQLKKCYKEVVMFEKTTDVVSSQKPVKPTK